ncbi:MAG: hypothetical protein QOA17_09850 [Nitrososphaeraceae archaeon]|nr:hypothetical protein [Nitrososphaeraceae archaeon]MDW0276206.1 hypothetical protein [Nitrososphaeraceae archaeon]
MHGLTYDINSNGAFTDLVEHRISVMWFNNQVPFIGTVGFEPCW